ncbi:hypothetical protein [Piscirickettsia litoralis]|uniref:hypothetical protein n=1 Tax=Piscirickettsia litoralis TaxID=1891921 RepID=UPI001112F5BF|nr:hypothetical protein [Piscirickettsia litoralis]
MRLIVLVASVNIPIFAQLTNVYRLTLVNETPRKIHFHMEQKQCTRYITPVNLVIKPSTPLVIHWITSAVNCVGRFAIIKLKVERESMDDVYLTLDVGLYGKGEIGVVSGGVPIRCVMTSYIEDEEIYDFKCSLR